MIEAIEGILLLLILIAFSIIVIPFKNADLLYWKKFNENLMKLDERIKGNKKMTDKIKSMFFVIDTPFKVALIYSNNRGERKQLDVVSITDGNEQKSCYEKLKEYTRQYDLFTFVYEPKENRVIFNFTDLE